MTIQVLGPGCKRCQALLALTEAAVADLHLGTPIEKVEDYAEMARLGVMSTPALAIDGRVVHAGSVPSAEQVRNLLSSAA